MQRKGERQTMTGKEYCRYIRTYSELEGLQRAHTVVYCAQTVPGGVLAQLRWEQAGRVQCSTALAPQGSFARMMQIALKTARVPLWLNQILSIPLWKQRGIVMSADILLLEV